MDVHKSSLLDIFDTKQRLEVPLFQRQYVWDEEHQWLPLWEDIERKFVENLEDRQDAPVHFLGAMVLDQKQSPTGHVVRRHVIDGQQRLTTFQIFLAAFRDFCDASGCSDIADECRTFTFNVGMMSDPTNDRFKVWPTQLDRSQFIDVISAGSREKLIAKHPQVWRKYQRRPDPRPRMVEAYLFFYESLRVFFEGDADNPAVEDTTPMRERLDRCLRALRSSLMVVVIDLQASDDPQVIFETLNARGAPLLPADLLRNYIFLRAARDGLDTESLYQRYWQTFDDSFWREEIKQGRLVRPRSDLYMQHFLASQQAQDIPIKHLYVEYRHWVERSKPFATVEQELASLSRNGLFYRRLLEADGNDFVAPLAAFLQSFDIGTAYPFLLTLLDKDIGPDQWAAISRILTSYLLRRAVGGLPTKNYNRVFLTLTRVIRRTEASADTVRGHLLSLVGDSAEWPKDEQFRWEWLNSPMYNRLSNARLVYLLSRLNEAYISNKTDPLVFSGQPTVEHLMPQAWIEHWPLDDGSKGIGGVDLWDAPAGDPTAEASRVRSDLVQTIGNLTILSSALNSAQSNHNWATKRPELLRHSLLPINFMIAEATTWDDASIRQRGEKLFEKALMLWPR